MTSGVYRLTNKITGYAYIGQSQDIEKRWRAHSKAYHNLVICRAIKKYGWDNFYPEILIITGNKDEMDRYETEYIKLYNTLTPNGYNVLPHPIKYGVTPEIAKKSGDVRRGKKQRPEWTQAALEDRMREAKKRGGPRKSWTMPPYWIEGHRQRMLGNTHTLGFKHSEESKAKMSIASMGRPSYMKGKTHTEKTKNKISARMLGIPKSEETKAKMKLAQLLVREEERLGIRKPRNTKKGKKYPKSIKN